MGHEDEAPGAGGAAPSVGPDAALERLEPMIEAIVLRVLARERVARRRAVVRAGVAGLAGLAGIAGIVGLLAAPFCGPPPASGPQRIEATAIAVADAGPIAAEAQGLVRAPAPTGTSSVSHPHPLRRTERARVARRDPGGGLEPASTPRRAPARGSGSSAPASSSLGDNQAPILE